MQRNDQKTQASMAANAIMSDGGDRSQEWQQRSVFPVQVQPGPLLPFLPQPTTDSLASSLPSSLYGTQLLAYPTLGMPAVHGSRENDIISGSSSAFIGCDGKVGGKSEMEPSQSQLSRLQMKRPFTDDVPKITTRPKLL